MFGTYENIKIAGISAVAPNQCVDNLELAEYVGGKRAKRQVLATGIKQRYLVVEGQSASDMCALAGERLLNKLGWDRNTIKAIVFVTQSPDLISPSTAMVIQKRLKIGSDCIAFDVNLGCSGYIGGLQIISSLLHKVGGRGLLLSGDGKHFDFKKNTTTNNMLFGDAGTATAIETEANHPIFYSMMTDGTRHHVISRNFRGEFIMDGNAVLLFSLSEVVESIKQFKGHFSIEEKDIEYYVFHQAQKIILDGIAHECNIDHSKVLLSYEKYGNTSTATIPLTICANQEKICVKAKMPLFLCGFGIGLSWGNIFLDMDTKNILPVEFSDYCYNDIPNR